MVKTKPKKTNKKNTTEKPIIFSLAIITLFFIPSTSDPFNYPKFWALMILGGWVLGQLVVHFTKSKKDVSKIQKYYYLIIFVFLVGMFISAINSNVLFTAFFGETQRRLGFLTYLFLAIFAISSSLFFKFTNIQTLFKSVLFIGIALAVYGLMQTTGNDFITWDNPYNSIILTLGNPNFASALMSIIAVMLTGYLFFVAKRYLLIVAILILTLIYLIILSNSRQGLITFGIGFSIIILYQVFKVNRRAGIIFSVATAGVATFVFLAMLQIGPLVNLIYKPSVSIRGQYWQAGINMFKDNAIFGVGVDSYVDFFRSYRATDFGNTYGYSLMTDNAHNVPIQIFATAGIITGIFYLFTIAFTFWCGVKAFRNTEQINKPKVLGIFASWLAFQAQTIISIDNIGLTIWGWVLGGILVALASESTSDANEYNFNHSNSSEALQKITSFGISLTFFVVSSLLYQGDKNLFTAVSFFNFNSPQQSNEFREKLSIATETKLNEPSTNLKIAMFWFSIGEKNKSRAILTHLLKDNPNSYNLLRTSAEFYEYSFDWKNSISTRKIIFENDPMDADNLLKLAEAYEKIESFSDAKSIYTKILKMSPNSNEASIANENIVRLSAK